MYLIKGNKFTIHKVVHFIQLYHMNVEFFNVQIKTKRYFLLLISIQFMILFKLCLLVIDGILMFENMASSNVH